MSENVFISRFQENSERNLETVVILYSKIVSVNEFWAKSMYVEFIFSPSPIDLTSSHSKEFRWWVTLEGTIKCMRHY